MADSLREAIRLIKDRVDLVEVVGRITPLKKAGTSYKGLCPFHKEKTPSFHVVPAKGIFHCFGCGEGGSAIDFVMKSERLEFMEAIRKLAADLGIPLPEQRPEDRRLAEEQTRQALSLQEANSEALVFFRSCLAEGRNALASAYLPERGLTEDLVEIFQIGASIDAWDGLKRHMNARGFSDDMLVKADLCVRSETGRVYDRFRNRLMFPIFDQNGKVVGFGGRQLVKDEKSGKYINTAETPLFKKSNLLYGLNLAQKEIERTGHAILCEGYMDVIMAHAHGHRQAVAPLGTALTTNQARLLKRFASRTYFLYDGDSAGQKAMMRGGIPLLEAGFDTRVIVLPPEDDPDSFLRREGGAALFQRIEDAEEFFDFAMRRESAGIDLNALAGQAELVERLAPVVVAFRNDVMREAAIARLLRRLGGLPREALTRILAIAEKRQASANAAPPLADPGSRRGEESIPSDEAALGTAGNAAVPLGAPRFDPLETSLLKLMLESPDALAYLREHLHGEWITDSRLEGWIHYLAFNQGYPNSLIDEAEASGELPGDRGVIAAVLAMELSAHGKGRDAAEQLIFRLHERHKHALTGEMMRMLDDPNLSEEAVLRLMKSFHQLHVERVRDASRHLRSGDRARRQPPQGTDSAQP
jgi:DNA primase